MQQTEGHLFKEYSELPISCSSGKDLQSHHSVPKTSKMLNSLKNQQLFLDFVGGKERGQTTVPKLERQGNMESHGLQSISWMES